MKGHQEIAQHLLECPTFILNENAPIGLGYAMIAEQDDIVTFVLNLDFDVNAEAEYSIFNGRTSARQTIKARSALKAAVRLKSVTYVTQIVNHRQFDPRSGGIRSALFASAKTGNLPTFQALLPFGDMGMRNRRGETLFVFLCLKASSDILEHIAALPGFAPSPREITQGLALNLSFANQTVFPILLGYEPNLNSGLPVWINGRRRKPVSPWQFETLRNERPRHELIGVPLLFATARFYSADALRSLWENAAVDRNARDEFGQTLLFELSNEFLTHSWVISCFRIDLNAQDLDGNTPLMQAIRRLAITVVNALITKGADLESRNFKGVLFHFI
jgi:hypothetical protein